MNKLIILILIFNLQVFAFAQYDFFDSFIKRFLDNVFMGSNNRPSYGNRFNQPTNQPISKPACECSMQNHNRIVGGKESPFIPWLVSLGYVYRGSTIKYSHFCGGAILNEYHILTAGHCLKDLNKNSVDNYLIRHGITDLNEKVSSSNTIQWEDFIVHESYRSNGNDNGNDIGIIKLKKPIDLRNSRSKAACLDYNRNHSPYLSLSGWGRVTPFGEHNRTGATLPTRLLQLDLTEDKSKSTSKIISAKGKLRGTGTCSGDSGSPLQAISPRNVAVVGLVSYGISNTEGVFCLSNTGFVRVQAHSRFIENIVGANNYCKI